MEATYDMFVDKLILDRKSNLYENSLTITSLLLYDKRFYDKCLSLRVYEGFYPNKYSCKINKSKLNQKSVKKYQSS